MTNVAKVDNSPDGLASQAEHLRCERLSVMAFSVYGNQPGTHLECADTDELVIRASGLLEVRKEDGETTLFSPSGWQSVTVRLGHTRNSYPD